MWSLIDFPSKNVPASWDKSLYLDSTWEHFLVKTDYLQNKENRLEDCKIKEKLLALKPIYETSMFKSDIPNSLFVSVFNLYTSFIFGFYMLDT